MWAAILLVFTDLICLQIHLSKKRNKFGLVLPIISFLFSIIFAISILIMAGISYETSGRSESVLNGESEVLSRVMRKKERGRRFDA